MPAASTRVTWKGAISFGLVHIPIELRSATLETRPQFKWIDSASKSAVGNQQVSKTTGKAIDPEKLVKGIEYEDGQFVTLTKEEIRAALPKAMQTIEIEAFVDAGTIPLPYFLKPYHVSPLGKGQKAYALLRETLKKTGKVGIAKVVITTRQHLAALMPMDNGMVLNLLRWEEEVRDMTGLALPDESVTVSDKEMKMAELLVNDLAAEWSPGLFHDEFKEQLQALIEKKASAGNLLTVANADGSEPVKTSADVIDLTELLQRSLQGKGGGATAAKPAKAKASNDSNVTPMRRAAAKKAPAKAVAAVKPVRKRSA